MRYREGMTERDKRIPDLVSKAEAAKILGDISHQAVQQMVAKGRLKGAQVGTTWVFRRAAVEALAKPRPCLCGHDKNDHGRDTVLGEHAGYCGSCSCAQFHPAA